MSLVTPAPMPARGAKDQLFEIQRNDFMAPEARGRMGGITAGFPLWITTMTIGTLTVAQSDAWRAFVSAQRGAQRWFYGFEIGRQMPRNYIGGFPSGFAGAATGWSQTLDASGFVILTLTGLPPGLALTTGDYVDFRWGTFQRALVRLMEPANADSGGNLHATIEPAVPVVVPANAIAHLDNPACLMKLNPQTSKLGAVGRRGAIESGTIEAVQDIVP